MAGKHWKSISASRFPWEQAALDFIHSDFPAQDNYVAWSNFEFIADDGSINEVDFLVACPQGIFLTEIKSKPGTVSGDANNWVWEHEGRKYSDDSPLILANRKCKRLKSLLSPQRVFGKLECPFIEPLVFISHTEVRVLMQGVAAGRICLRDKPATPTASERPGILAAIRRRECSGLPPRNIPVVNRPQIRAFAQAMEQAGIHPRQAERRVGDFVLDKLLYESSTEAYQAWQAHHVTHTSTRRLATVNSINSVKLTEFECQLDKLKTGTTLTEKELENDPKSQDGFWPGMEDTTVSAETRLSSLKSELDGVHKSWTKSLLNDLADPVIQSHFDLLKPAQKKMLKDFMSEMELPDDISQDFSEALRQALSGLAKLPVRLDDLRKILFPDGSPAMPPSANSDSRNTLSKSSRGVMPPESDL